MTSEELRIIAEVHDQWAFEMDEQVPPDPAGALVAGASNWEFGLPRAAPHPPTVGSVPSGR